MTFIDGRAVGKIPDYSGITKTSISNFIDKGTLDVSQVGSGRLASSTPKLSPEEGLKVVNFDQNKLQAESNIIRHQLGI